VFISNENFYTQFVDTLEKLAENKLEFNKEFDIAEFSCETQTNRLITLLKL